jgi:hypothetical protein
MFNSSELPPFIESLHTAAQSRWSGMLRARRADKQVGVVVMHDGHVAWAVSSGLSEDFSSVLERIGLVSREKLTAANHALQTHRSLGKTMSLGALLVAECLISPSVLRTCFKTQVSAALASLVETPLLSLHPEDERLSVDTSLLFHLNEVLPGTGNAGEAALAPLSAALCGESPVESELLKGLALLPGYRYSFIADTDGNLLACHTGDEVKVQVERIIPKALTWLSAACTISEETEMGLVVSAFLHGETGSLFAQMTDERKRFFVAVSFSSAGKLGVIKHKISELIPALRRFTEGL